MSADFPSEGAACQCIYWEHPCRRPRSFPLPLANPGAPAVKSKRNESSTGYEFVNLRLPRCGLHAGSEIIVDHKPTTVGQQITIAIQVPAHIVICIENEEPDFTVGKHLPNGCYRRLLEGGTVDQIKI